MEQHIGEQGFCMNEESTIVMLNQQDNYFQQNNQEYNLEDQNSINSEATTEELFDEEALQQVIQMLSDDLILVPSIQQPSENHQIQYPDQDPSDPNQCVMYSSPRPMFNPAPELSFGIGQNLPPEGCNVNSNRATIPSMGYLRTRRMRASYRRGRMPPLLRGSSARSGRVTIEREMETNRQYQNAPTRTTARGHPWDPRRIPIRNSLFDPSYAENGLPVDPFLRFMQLNPNFGNNRGNN